MVSGEVLTDYVSQYFGFWVGFQLGPSKKDLNIAFNGRENPQRGPRNTQYSVPPSKVQHRRVGIPGDFSVLEVHVVEVAG